VNDAFSLERPIVALDLHTAYLRAVFYNNSPLRFSASAPPYETSYENTRTARSHAGEDVYGRESRLPRQQSADVTQQLGGADRAVTVVFDQAVDDLVDAAQLVGVGRPGRGGDLHNVLEVGEDLLLDGLFQPFVRVVLEGLAFARI